jgi:polyisoprenoid-binding protein YceI
MMRLISSAVLVVGLVAAVPARAAETYKADPVHSSAVFRVKHANAGYVWGRFNDPAGTFVLDEADPTKSSFTVELQAAKVDTNNAQRDGHLKSPDFFNARQNPKITFKSTSVKKLEDNKLEVAGDLTLNGQTKPVTVVVELVGKGQFMGQPRAGVEATASVRMTEFGMKGNPALGDEVRIVVALEGVKQ